MDSSPYISPISEDENVTCTMCDKRADHYDDDSLPYCADASHNSITRPGAETPLRTDEYDKFLQYEIGYIIRRLGLLFGDHEQREHMIRFAANELRHTLLD